ncbi:hypothetical protein L1987_24062 [Smallanthus sonchifolius]|uniref:Uncharacterized protein n=1 Tax=Smallanthus sonchifolius TaxID=185202 RepID=A0ACB9IIN2_9ASTR|nr:hypothetical protein L1987_24062 [Smallanthus sonchifolius]
MTKRSFIRKRRGYSAQPFESVRYTGGALVISRPDEDDFELICYVDTYTFSNEDLRALLKMKFESDSKEDVEEVKRFIEKMREYVKLRRE